MRRSPDGVASAYSTSVYRLQTSSHAHFCSSDMLWQSFDKHLRDNRFHFSRRFISDLAQALTQPLSVNGSYLIENDPTPFAPKRQRNPSRIRMRFRGHRRNDHGLDVTIHLVGRNHEARSGLFDLVTNSMVKEKQENSNIPLEKLSRRNRVKPSSLQTSCRKLDWPRFRALSPSSKSGVRTASDDRESRTTRSAARLSLYPGGDSNA